MSSLPWSLMGHARQFAVDQLLPESPSEETLLAPGVVGWTTSMRQDGRVYVPVIRATSPGSGDVGRWLDSLGPETRIPNVISGRLARMLQRRGWVPISMLVGDEECDVWLHPAAIDAGHRPLDIEECIAKADEYERVLAVLQQAAAEARAL